MFDLYPAILKFLKLPPGTSSKIMISKSKQWNKVKMTLRSYLTDLTKVIAIYNLKKGKDSKTIVNQIAIVFYTYYQLSIIKHCNLPICCNM